MEKKLLKMCLLIISLLFITGCNVNYELEIYNLTYTEKATIKAEKIETVDKFGITAGEVLDGALAEYEMSAGSDDLSITNKSKDNTIDLLATKSGNLTELKTSVLAANCFELFNILVEDEQIVVSTSQGAECFNKYTNLNTLTVKIKSNHKLISTNADQNSKDTYTWEITRDNYQTKSILMTLEKDEYVKNYDNRNQKNMIYIALILIIIVVVITSILLFVRMKSKKANEI